MRTYTRGNRSLEQSRMLNEKHASKNRESKSFTKSLRESLRGIPEVVEMGEEVASEEEVEGAGSEADASKRFAKMIYLAVLRSSVALVVWYPTMDCICTNSFLLENFLIEPRPG
jgi:hypothetical protein